MKMKQRQIQQRNQTVGMREQPRKQLRNKQSQKKPTNQRVGTRELPKKQ